MAHFFLSCQNCNNIRVTLINELSNIDTSITSRQPNNLSGSNVIRSQNNLVRRRTLNHLAKVQSTK